MVTWLRLMLESWDGADRSELHGRLSQFRLSDEYQEAPSCVGPILRYLERRNFPIDEGLLEILLKDALRLGFDDNVEFVLRHVCAKGGLEQGRCLWMAVWYGQSAHWLLVLIERGFGFSDGYSKQELETFLGTRADPVLSLVKSQDACVEIAMFLFVLGFPFDAARQYVDDNPYVVDLTQEMSSFIQLGHDERTKRTAWLVTVVDRILRKLHSIKDRTKSMALELSAVAPTQLPVELWCIIAEQALSLYAWDRISYWGLISFMSK